MIRTDLHLMDPVSYQKQKPVTRALDTKRDNKPCFVKSRIICFVRFVKSRRVYLVS